VTLFLIVEVPMAIHLIISGLLKLLKPGYSSEFLHSSIQLLNFAILLSYPINFFIYCRMSRAFRDAFTKLLCPSINQSRQERLPSTATQLLTKPHKNNNNNNNFELHKTNNEILPSSTVILNTTTAETSMSVTPSINASHIIDNRKKDSIVLLAKPRVLFRDDISSSKTSKSTDL
jgi:hypothetical protein